MLLFFHTHHYVLIIFLLIMGFLGGLVDSIAGGGGLVSFPALLLSGMPILNVLGTNKFQSAIGAAVAVYKYYTAGLIDFMTVLRGLIMGFIGAVFGAYTINHTSNYFMSYIIPFLMLAIFIFTFVNKELGLHARKKYMSENMFFIIFGFVLGFYDAFFGPGTGNFWVVALVVFVGYPFLKASGYAKVLNLKSNVFSLCIFLYYKKVNFVLGSIMALGQILGSYTGASLVILHGSKLVRKFLLTIVFLNVIATFYVLLRHNPHLQVGF